MTLDNTLALLRAILVNLPAAILTGRELINLINETYEKLDAALSSGNTSPDEIDALITRIVATSANIQSQT